MLSPYRVLDLTDEKGFLCGKMLADLGADVIKVEKPGGDRSRNIGPFYHNIPDPEKSLYWFAYNANKRGITLNVDSVDGKRILTRLIRTFDVVIESFPPGHIEHLDLGYSSLVKINPGIIMASITPFGNFGPYRDYKTSDIVCMALGGYMYLCGDADRAPVRVSIPQAYLHAAADAAVAIVIALHYRKETGLGQHIDTSAQAATVMCTLNNIAFWELSNTVLRRAGPYRAGLSSGAIQRQTWRCKDGFVTLTMYGGKTGAVTNHGLVEWMNSEGVKSDFLNAMDWENFDTARVDQATWDKIQESIAGFLLQHTKSELFEGAAKRGIMLYPVASCIDLITHQHLKERDFWQEVEHPELDTSILYPGLCPKSSATELKIKRRAPLIGEHNEEIYTGELGLSPEELLILRQSEVI